MARLSLATLCAALPAAVFAISGVFKWVAPGGTLPRGLVGSVTPSDYALMLRGLGVLEVLLALALLLAWTRRPARWAAFALLGLLSAFVAFNAADGAFLKDCGCMGEIELPKAVFGSYVGLLLRNAVLAFLVALGAYLDPPSSLRPSVAASHAAVAAGLLLLGTLYVAERSRVAGVQEHVGWMLQGSQRARRLGWALPPLRARDAQGQPVTLAEAVRPKDQVVFFSTKCPFCELAAPTWATEAVRRKAEGTRLLLVAAGETGGPAGPFLARHGAGGLPYVVLEDPSSLALLGLEGVPSRLVLDEEKRVTAHEAYGAPPSLLAALETSQPVWPDAAASLWSALAIRGFGPGATLEGPPRKVEGGHVAQVVAGGEARGRLLVATSTLAPAEGLEVVVAVAADGRVVLLEILAAGPFAGDLAGVRERLPDLVGVPPAELAVRAAGRAVPGDPSAPAWQTLRNVLQRVPQLLGGP